MAKSSKSLRGIVCYSLCLCLAFGVLSCSLYSFLSSDEKIEQRSANAAGYSDELENSAITAFQVEEHDDTSHSNSDIENIVVKSSDKTIHTEQDTQDIIPLDTEKQIKEEILSKEDNNSVEICATLDEGNSDTLAFIQLRDADLTPEEDDDIVVYAAEKTIIYSDEKVENLESIKEEQDTILVEDNVICPEIPSLDNSIVQKEEDSETEEQNFCIPAHGENTFEVTPEYIDELNPSTPREPIYIRDKVRNGDSAGKILNAWLSPSEIHNLLDATNKLYKLSKIRVGQPYTVTLDPYDKSFQHFSYEINSSEILTVSLDKAGSSQSLESTSKEKKFVAEITGILYDYKLELVQGKVENSLYGAVVNAGESTALGAQLTDIFGWEIDFVNDIRQGDTFTALVEKRYRNGDFKGYGRVLCATYTNAGELYEAFRFSDEYGGNAYFDRDGNSLRKAFLKAPLNFTRISSPYTMNRFHPVLKKNRPHQGIDYAAPTGTPVKSVGDGVVIYRGWMNGYGNIVRIRHANNIETMYSHLSKFAKNLKTNQRVRQGQVIAYVGSTGLSTGPHLDFRVRKNGQFVNPNTLLNPRSNPVPKKLMADFKKRIELYAQLQKNVGSSAYMPELVVEK